MQEHRRQFYLSALGIAGYEPRWQLPGAAASVACDWGEPLDSVSEAEPSAAEPSHRPQPPAQVRQALEQVVTASQRPATKAVAGEAKPVAPAVNQAADDHKYLGFTLSVWQIARDLRVVDSRRPRLALPTDTLLLNMLRALGYPLEQLPAGERLRTTAAQVAPDDPLGYAQAQVQAYLMAQQEMSSVPKVLLMGAAAARLTLPSQHWPTDGNAGQLLGQWYTLPDTGQQALVLPSLTAMLQNPQLKAVAWQALKPLVKQSH